MRSLTPAYIILDTYYSDRDIPIKSIKPIDLPTSSRMSPIPRSCQRLRTSKLPTPSNNNIAQRPIALSRPRRLNLAHNIHAIQHLAEDDVLAVEMRRRGC
jgi:hypothetical protein